MSYDPYIDDGAEDLDDREAAGYYDDTLCVDPYCELDSDHKGGCRRPPPGYYDNDARLDQHDTREEANGER